MSENKARHKPGLYTATVVESTIGKLGTKGNNALVLLCQLVEHSDHAGFKTQIDGNELVRVTVWLTTKTLGNQVTQDQLAIFGAMPQVLADLNDNKFVGKEISLYCKLEDNAEGDTYSNFSISTGRGISTNLKEKATPDDIRKLMALCGGGGGAATAVYDPPPAVVDADNF